jgi:hypothetical protein
MPRSTVAILRVILAIFAGYGVALCWWYLWMYKGWPGSPHLLHSIWPDLVDGEFSYDVTLTEMWILSGSVVLIFSGPLLRKIKRNEVRNAD